MLTTNGKANGWRATAAEEFRRIRTRWGIPAITQFSHYLGINYRTTTKLLSADPKYPLKLETVLKAFSNLRVSVWLEFNTPEDVNNEMQQLEHAMANVISACFPPSEKVLSKAVSEMENQRGCGVPVK